MIGVLPLQDTQLFWCSQGLNRRRREADKRLPIALEASLNTFLAWPLWVRSRQGKGSKVLSWLCIRGFFRLWRELSCFSWVRGDYLFPPGECFQFPPGECFQAFPLG